MGEKNTIDSLLSTSIQDDFTALPLFYEGRIVKRISKEEIQGWGQGGGKQAFHVERQRIAVNRRDRGSVHRKMEGEAFENAEELPPPSLLSFKNKLNAYKNHNDPFKTFRTVEEMPKHDESAALLPNISGGFKREETKVDFVQGKRLISISPPPRKQVSLKPLFSTFSSFQENIQGKSSSLPSKSKLLKQGGSYTHKQSKSSDRRLTLISYPLDMQTPIAKEESSMHCKLTQYLKKYQLSHPLHLQ